VVSLASGSRIPHGELSREEVAKLKRIEKATLGAAESVALWDAVIPSLRPRPGAFGQ
jgi:hypothetical protein